VPGITIHMQAVPGDLSIDATGSRSHTVALGKTPIPTSSLWGAQVVDPPNQLPAIRRPVASRPAARERLAATSPFRRDTGGALRHHAGEPSTMRSTTLGPAKISRRSSPSRNQYRRHPRGRSGAAEVARLVGLDLYSLLRCGERAGPLYAIPRTASRRRRCSNQNRSANSRDDG